jgi:hypothetical protein
MDEGSIYVRSIYIWNAIAIFCRNRRGTYIKPTEGISKTAYNNIKKILEKHSEGFWLWMASTKDSDIEIEKRSRIYGAVYVTGIMGTREYKRQYNKKRVMEYFKESGEGAYQLIIPMREDARIELKEPLEVHEYRNVNKETRQSGVWEPCEESRLWERLRDSEYV